MPGSRDDNVRDAPALSTSFDSRVFVIRHDAEKRDKSYADPEIKIQSINHFAGRFPLWKRAKASPKWPFARYNATVISTN